MRLFTCRNHDGFWPVPRASVIVALDEEHARALLDAALAETNLKPGTESPYDLTEIDLSTPQAVILADGDY